MKKIIYTLLSVLCVLLAAGTSLAQAPDGHHCTSQPYGNLFFKDYPATSTFPGGTEIHGVGAADVPSFGPRGSMVFKYRSDTFVPTLEATAIILDSLALTIGGFAEFEFEPGNVGDVLYGTGLRYDGPTPVESSIYINATWGWGPLVVKTSQISATGKYTVETSIGRKLYGLRSGGGNHGAGVFFSINSDGTGYTELYHFLGAYERPDHLMLRYEHNEDGTPDLSQPTEFWGISYAGGSHGKGALIEISLDGSSVATRLDFTGYGGADNSWGPTDGDGPVAILQDIDTDGYVITRSGGANNKGAIFLIGDDGNYKVHDFTAQYGTPTSSAAVDKTAKMVFGIGGDEAGNDGFIYSFSLLSDLNFNDHLIDFNNNTEFKNPVSLAPSMDGLLYLSVAQGNSLNGNGAFLSVNHDGSNLTKLAEYEDCFTTLISPADNATNVSLTPVLKGSNVDTYARYQLSETPDFSDDFTYIEVYNSDEAVVTIPLKPSTLYYARIDSDVSFPGPITTFTTVPLNQNSTHVIDPADNAVEVSVKPVVKIKTVPGTTTYTLELSENQAFTENVTVKTSTSPQISLSGLAYSKTYYTRAKSNLSSGFSVITKFTTHAPNKYAFVSDPVNGAINRAKDNLKVTANIVYGAFFYTIELSTSPSFSPGTTISKTSASAGQRTLIFDGLTEGATYYSRVKTDLYNIPGPVRTFTVSDDYSYVIDPADNKTDVSINPVVRLKLIVDSYGNIADDYQLWISEYADFSDYDVVFIDDNTEPITTPTPLALKYGTTYYTMVKTNLTPDDDFGRVTTFTTHPAEKYSFVSSPVNGATNVAFNNLKVTANQIVGATTYTIELNTSPDFTGTSIVKTSAVPLQRTITFNGLSPSTTYYNRTRTNLPGDWGPVRSFTTAPAPPPPAENISGESPIVRAYPNPFKVDFTAEVQNIVDERATIVLMDVTGRQVYSGEIGNNEAIQLGSELPRGMYILQVRSRTSNSIHRLAKE